MGTKIDVLRLFAIMGQHSHITTSEFAMWRAVFAFSFVDNSLSIEEQELLRSYLSKVPFTPPQLAILRADMQKPRHNVEELYRQITDAKDKKQFCLLARALVWCEGSMAKQEEVILKRVACLKDDGESEHLYASRNHLHIHDYYQQYAKSGVVGLFKEPPKIQIRI